MIMRSILNYLGFLGAQEYNRFAMNTHIYTISLAESETDSDSPEDHSLKTLIPT